MPGPGLELYHLLLFFLQELTAGLQSEEDKSSRLSKMKTKLENTIAETNDELEREKRLRGDTEKVRRKLEADLKVRNLQLYLKTSLIKDTSN